MSQKIAIITGSNTGLGYWNALDLSKEGYKIIMACRTISKAEDAKKRILEANPGGDLEVMQIDLSSLNSVRAFAQKFVSKYSRLDILINNAGIMLVPENRTEDGFESTMGANYFGHFLLTGLLLPVIKKTPGARVVSLSSNAHKAGKINFDDINFEKKYSSWGAYAQSKLACLMFAYELQRRFEKHNIEAISVAAHPGGSDTDLSRHLPIPKWGEWIIRKTLVPIFAQSAEAGSKPTLMAAISPDTQGGDYYGPDGFGELKGKPVKVKSTKLSYDQEVAHKLWEVSEDLTGVEYSF